MAFYASHRNRELAVVERLSTGAHAVAATVADGSVVSGAVVLPTCNRFEVYVEADSAEAARQRVVGALVASTDLSWDEADGSLDAIEGDDAVRHLLSVATGLESMVVGEREISGQVRRAHADARVGGHLTPRLDRLFQSALRTARVVGSSTGLGTSGRSVVSVALDLAGTTVTWQGARVLVIGTGELAQSALATIHGLGAQIVAVHSPSGRDDLAASAYGALTYGAPVIGPDALVAAVSDADVVLACSGGDHEVLTAAMVGEALRGTARELTIIDLALHHDVGPLAGSLPGVHLINLETVGEHAPGEEVGAIEAARAIVAHAVARFDDQARALDPAVVALREHVFGLLEREVAALHPGASASAEDVARAAAAEAALRHFAKSLLHLPTVRAREHAVAGEHERYLEAVRALYGLDVAVPDDACPATDA